MQQGLLDIKDTPRTLGWSYPPRHRRTVGPRAVRVLDFE